MSICSIQKTPRTGFGTWRTSMSSAARSTRQPHEPPLRNARFDLSRPSSRPLCLCYAFAQRSYNVRITSPPSIHPEPRPEDRGRPRTLRRGLFLPGRARARRRGKSGATFPTPCAQLHPRPGRPAGPGPTSGPPSRPRRDGSRLTPRRPHRPFVDLAPRFTLLNETI